MDIKPPPNRHQTAIKLLLIPFLNWLSPFLGQKSPIPNSHQICCRKAIKLPPNRYKTAIRVPYQLDHPSKIFDLFTGIAGNHTPPIQLPSNRHQAATKPPSNCFSYQVQKKIYHFLARNAGYQTAIKPLQNGHQTASHIQF